MIDDAEIRRRAEHLGVQTDHVERDYVLNHILAHVSTDPGTLIFRGGTALARAYWPDFRLSEDLDFITPGNGEDIERVERTTQFSTRKERPESNCILYSALLEGIDHAHRLTGPRRGNRLGHS